MADQTKFILNTSSIIYIFFIHTYIFLNNIFDLALYFGAVPLDDSAASSVRDFLENSELTVLAATQAINGGIRFAHRVATEETCLLFYKIPQIGGDHQRNQHEDVKSGGMAALSLGILTIDGGLVKSIYDSMVRVYLPQGTLVV